MTLEAAGSVAVECSGQQDDDEKVAGTHLHTALRDVLGSLDWGQ